MNRFFVQEPHIAGLAVLDRELSTLVVSSFGDTSQEAREALQSVANALNTAIDSARRLIDTDTFKQVSPSLNWVVIQYLSGEIQRLKDI